MIANSIAISNGKTNDHAVFVSLIRPTEMDKLSVETNLFTRQLGQPITLFHA